jgi:hypothetical protein
MFLSTIERFATPVYTRIFIPDSFNCLVRNLIVLCHLRKTFGSEVNSRITSALSYKLEPSRITLRIVDLQLGSLFLALLLIC